MIQETANRNTPGGVPRDIPSSATIRSLMFTACFFMVMTAYYHVKPVTRTIFITFVGSEKLPLIWIASAIILSLLLPFLLWRTKRVSREHAAVGGGICLAGVLILFRFLLATPSLWGVTTFYIIVDIYSVILLEQLWGLAGASHELRQASRWYGLIGSGGLLGAICGSFSATLLLAHTRLEPLDLLVIAALVLLLFSSLILVMQRKQYFVEPYSGEVLPDREQVLPKGPKRKQYVLFILAFAVIAQFVEPIVEFGFMYQVEQGFSSLEERTVYLSRFFIVMGVLALAVNLLCTPVILRKWGASVGLAVQPLLLLLGAIFAMMSPSLLTFSTLKLYDRSMSYSINRATKELLYNLLPPDYIQQLKCWIDMFGYRLFKVLASLILLGSMEIWRPELVQYKLSWAIGVLAVVWLVMVAGFRFHYHRLLHYTVPSIREK